MALNKDTLGLALYNRSLGFNDQAIDVTDPAAMEEYRLNFWKAIADEVINHFKDHADGIYQTGSLIAGSSPVTRVGTATNVKIQ